MAQQTAVEWLQIQLKNGVEFNPLDPLSYPKAVDNLFEKAKQMEKEQIIKTSKDSYIAGYIDNQCKVDDSMNFPEEYYNETYNK